MSLKRSVHFTDEAYEVIFRISEEYGISFNQAVNDLAVKFGKCEVWRKEEIRRAKEKINLLESNTMLKPYPLEDILPVAFSKNSDNKFKEDQKNRCKK